MSLTENAAYLKGLADGMELGDSKQEKLLKAVIEMLGDLAQSVEGLDSEMEAVCEELDEIEADIYELDDEDFDFDDEDEDEDEDEDDDEDDDEDFEAEVEYELTCPACGATVIVDEETLLSQEIYCGQCKAPIEIEVIDEDAEDEE